MLPTSRTARFSSPLGVYDFQKRSSVIRISRAGAATLGAIAAELARGEGLTAHARSAELRMQDEPRWRSKPEEIIRDEIRALAGYHVPDSAGMVKLDAMENPYRLPEDVRARHRALVARRGDQPLSGRRRRRG